MSDPLKSDTPRTDEQESKAMDADACYEQDMVNAYEFARELERELNDRELLREKREIEHRLGVSRLERGNRELVTRLVEVEQKFYQLAADKIPTQELIKLVGTQGMTIRKIEGLTTLSDELQATVAATTAQLHDLQRKWDTMRRSFGKSRRARRVAYAELFKARSRVEQLESAAKGEL